MRILVVEDEAHTRAELVYTLHKLEPALEILGATSAPEALSAAQLKTPDAAFLDITLPGASGLSLAADLLALPQRPLLVFSTAAPEHALEAFNLAAVDYLVKPYREARVAQTLARLRGALAGQFETGAAPPALARLWVARPGGGGLLLAYNEICWIEAEGKRLHAHTRRGERYALKGTLQDLETQLKPHSFVRTHKSYLVNLAQVGELEPWFSGAYRLRILDAAGSAVPLSRQYAKRLKEKTGWL